MNIYSQGKYRVKLKSFLNHINVFKYFVICYHFVTVLSLSDLSCKCKGHYRTHFLQNKYIYFRHKGNF